MGMYSSIQTSARQLTPAQRRERLSAWRRENAVTRIERPTNLTRARSLGYRAKQGILLARVRVLRGGRRRPLIKKGRRTKARRRLKILSMSYQTICEQRANKSFHNCEVLNSYYVSKDGKYIWYEVILVDPLHPAIKKDKQLNWTNKAGNRGRVYRGKTSSARRTRGLHKKGKGTEKVRPGQRSRKRLAR